MLQEIDKYISENNIDLAIKECEEKNYFSLGTLISKISGKEIISEKQIKIKLICNWCSSKELSQLWNKMSQGNYRWNNLKIVFEDENIDYYVIINSPMEAENFIPEKTFLFQMEPELKNNPNYPFFVNCEKFGLLKIFDHKNEYNNIEWHLSKSYYELKEMEIKKTKILSTVLSSKYRDFGHTKRVDFVKFLEKKNLEIDVYGDNKWDYKNYKGSLPYHCKDDAIFPYKYTFNVENKEVKNYFTEKLIDGILGECLVFYSGCYNIREFFDERCFVYLELKNFEKDYQIIKNAIEKDLHSQRLPYILEAKKKILEDMNFFSRLEREIKKIKKFQIQS